MSKKRYASLLNAGYWWDDEVVDVVSGLHWDGVTNRDRKGRHARPFGAGHRENVSAGAIKLEARMLDAIERKVLEPKEERDGHYLLAKKEALGFVQKVMAEINAEVKADTLGDTEKVVGYKIREGLLAIPDEFLSLLDQREGSKWKGPRLKGWRNLGIAMHRDKETATIRVVDDKGKGKGNAQTLSYSDMGLARKDKDAPVLAWDVLLSLAIPENSGSLDAEKESDKLRKQVAKLNSRLSDYFDLEGNAIVYENKDQKLPSGGKTKYRFWRAEFSITMR